MPDFESHFNSANQGSIDKWRQYLSTVPLQLNEEDVPDELVPFYGTRKFEELNIAERQALFFGFIRFQAEVIALFEDFLLVGFRKLKEKELNQSSAAIRKFCAEEFYHSQAFRHFLRHQKLLQYPEKSVLLRKGKWLRTAAHLISRSNPYSILIQGAKAETYSMYFSKYVSNFTKKNDPWGKLNRLHLEDEAYHIPLGYEYFDRHILAQGSLKSLTSLAFCIAFTVLAQFILAMGMWRLTAECPTKLSYYSRIIRTVNLVTWMLTKFEPYVHTRKHLRSYYARRKFSFYKLLGIIHFGGARAKT
jgi:hypothetical protein